MSATTSSKTRKPDADTQALVVNLVETIGLIPASKRLGISRLATLNIAYGGDIFASTLAKVATALARTN